MAFLWTAAGRGAEPTCSVPGPATPGPFLTLDLGCSGAGCVCNKHSICPEALNPLFVAFVPRTVSGGDDDFPRGNLCQRLANHTFHVVHAKLTRHRSPVNSPSVRESAPTRPAELSVKKGLRGKRCVCLVLVLVIDRKYQGGITPRISRPAWNAK